jgi:hypothetical protein
MYAWDAFYKQFAHEFEGFTRSESNSKAVHAFQFRKNDRGEVVVQVKDSAAVREEEWRGGASEETVQGFPVMHTTPVGFPELIAPTAPGLSDKQKKSLLHKTMRKKLELRDRADAIPWLREVMETGFVPVHELRAQLPGDVGPRGIIGVPSGKCEVQYLSGSHRLLQYTHFFLGALGPADTSLEVPDGPVVPPPTQQPRQKEQAKFGYKGT